MSNKLNMDFYNKVKIIISGCKTKSDCEDILYKISKEDDKIKIIASCIETKSFGNIIDLKNLKIILEELNKLKYREDVYEQINKLTKKTDDISQLKTFIRIANAKPLRPQYVTLRDIRERNQLSVIKKSCPHCSHENVLNPDTDYAICGYNEETNEGYDWNGCGCDWCFKCGKILCKKWQADDLFILTNRFHDDKCCKKHSENNNLKYPDDYCMCKNLYVSR